MASRGGNQRALLPPQGKDLYYGRLLFEAIWARSDRPGQRFAEEYERLYHRWRRLVKGIIRYWGRSPLGVIEDTERDLENLELHHRNNWYPTPKPLTAAEQACLEWRATIAGEALNEIYLGLGRPLNHPRDWDGTQEPWKTWEDVSVFLANWADEPAVKANPHVKQKRWRRRTIIVKYRQEVAEFCNRWRLKAWWASPGIIQHHFLLSGDESDWDPTLPPLSMYAFPDTPVSLPLMVRLPGRTEDQFKLDRTKALSLVETATIQGAGGPIRVVRTHFSHEALADWEKTIDSSCVTLFWDGQRYLRKGILPGKDEPVQATPGDYLVDQCQQRLGRPLKVREAQVVRGQAWAQQKQYWDKLGKEGWTAFNDGNLKFIAKRVARLLLTPNVTWERLTPVVQDGKGKNRYGDPRSIRRACENFASLANLDLPPKRLGRPPGSRKIDR